MQNFSTSPLEMFASLWRNRNLIGALARREVLGRYRGSVMGILWSFFNPVFMLAVYTFVFSVVFKARWSVDSDSKTEFALILFAGLLVFNLFAECVNRAPALVLANANYVKKVVFPLEILPWVVFGAAVFHLLVSMCVWLLFYTVFLGVPHPTILFFPLVLLPLALITMGVSWLIASLGVYLRDVGHVIGIVTTTLMFLSPIFFPISSVPQEYRYLLDLNPLVFPIEQARDVLIWGKWPDPVVLCLHVSSSLLIAWLGFIWFQKTRRGFSDVL